MPICDLDLMAERSTRPKPQTSNMGAGGSREYRETRTLRKAGRDRSEGRRRDKVEREGGRCETCRQRGKEMIGARTRFRLFPLSVNE